MSNELTWWKSSYSAAGNQDCVEVAIEWRKSLRSQGASNCVEVGMLPWDWKKSLYSTGANNCVETKSTGQVLLVRDTKDHSKGILSVSPAAWSQFLGHIA